MMISREFVEWLGSKPIRLMAMVAMVMVLTFSLIMLFGMHFHTAQLAEQQVEQLKRIEAEAMRAKEEAVKAKAEAMRARSQADKNTKDVKSIEQTIEKDR